MKRIAAFLCLLMLQGVPLEVQAQITTPASFAEIAAKIADYLGLEAEELNEDQDLIADYQLDQLAAYEVVAMLCDTYGRPLPTGEELTQLGEIAAYLMTPAESVVTTRALPEPPYRQKVYFGTDRRRTDSEDPLKMYSGQRSLGGQVEYGTAEITIPANHKAGRLESPFLGISAFASPEKHVRLVSINPMTGDAFWDDVSGFMEQGSDDVFVFIHGFNVKFEEAARRTAQMAFDTGFEGLPMFWSWPSDARLLGYLADREDVEWSAAHIEQFLRDTRANTGTARMHLVAHSMGSQGLLRALRLVARRQDARAGFPLFDNVLLAAPDFDSEIFAQQIADEVLPVSKRWTVYASEQDAALQLSTKLSSVRRLGLPIVAVGGVDMIDASGIQVTPWNVPEFHSYYATKRRVIDDISAVLEGLAPAKRRLSQSVLNELPYWQLGSEEAQAEVVD